MKKKKQSEMQRFLALSDAEKDAEVAEFEHGVDRSKFHPLKPAQRKQWERSKRKMGRPTVGEGAKVVAVTIEGGLLRRADRYAKQHAMKRAEMVARGLELLMAG